MALRLAGEEFSVVQGLDGMGWLRNIQAADGLPGISVRQDGSGRVFEFKDGAAAVLYCNDGGDVTLGTNFDLANYLLKNARLGTVLNGNGQSITGLDTLAGQATAMLLLAGRRTNNPTSLVMSTPGVSPGYADTSRITVQGTVAVADIDITNAYLDLADQALAGSAGASAGYFVIKVGGTQYKVQAYALS